MINRLTGLFKKGSIIKKIILCYCVVLLSMCATNIVFYCVVKNMLTERELSNGEEYLRSLSVIMDQKLTEVHNLSYSFLTNGDNIMRMNDIESIQNQYRLGIELNHLMISSAIADKVFLYNQNKALVCSDEGVFRQSSFMCEAYGWSADALQNLNNALAKNKGYVIFAPSEFLEDSDGGDITMIIATSEIDDNSSRLIITVNDSSYRKLVSNGSGNDGEVYIINETGGILFATSKMTDRSKIITSVVESRRKRGNMNAEDNFVLWCNSDCFPGTYIRLVPEKAVSRVVRGISICLVAECILLMLIGIAALPALVKISYMPIYNILSYFRSLFGDTSEVTNEYTYIISGLGALNSKIKANNESMLLYDYLHNGCYHEEIADMFTKEYFAVAVVKMRSAGLVSAFDKYMASYTENVKCLAMSKYKYAVIMSMDTDDTNEYQRFLGDIMSTVSNAGGERILAAMSDSLSGVEKINLLYRRAEVACDNGTLDSIGTVFVYNADSGSMQGQLYFPDGVEEHLIDAVKNGDRDSVLQHLDELFKRNSRISLYLFEILKTRLLNLYFKVGMMRSEPVDYDNDVLEREYEPDKIREEFVKMFDKLINEGSKSTEPLSKTQKLLIDYVNSNYSSSALNIDMLAAYLNLSVPYTSKLFKQTTGQTFKEYLTNKRVDEAKNLMSTTTYSIKEISEMVGAGTYNSFVRMFKNKVGISPGQYRSMDVND